MSAAAQAEVVQRLIAKYADVAETLRNPVANNLDAEAARSRLSDAEATIAYLHDVLGALRIAVSPV